MTCRVVHSEDDVEVWSDGERYVVSEYQVWLEGGYDSVEAALAAVRVEPWRLHEIWQAKRPALLTVEDLR